MTVVLGKFMIKFMSSLMTVLKELITGHDRTVRLIFSFHLTVFASRVKSSIILLMKIYSLQPFNPTKVPKATVFLLIVRNVMLKISRYNVLILRHHK